MDANEVQQLKDVGVKVLSRRHIECYLFDNDVLQALCDSVQRGEVGPELIAAKQSALQASIQRGNDPDDLKSIAGEVFNEARRLLNLSQPGSNSEAFAKGKLAPLLRPGMKAYDELYADIFG